MNNQDESDTAWRQAIQADILIVDDVLDNIRLLSNMLERHGYQTRKAVTGAMAITAATTAPPSLILMDVRMPGLSGYEICQQLKSNPQTQHIPIIFLSAADEVSDKVQAFQVGGADYITKPFHVEEVLARVQHQLTIITAQQTISRLNTQLEARVRERTQQLEIANDRLSAMAFQDSLTQLPNRALLMQRLQEAIARQQANPDEQFAIFYLDCDRFKVVNDSLGHPTGDELLIAISQRLKLGLRNNDLLARLGGDEFVILLTHFKTRDSVIQVAERVLSHFALPFHLRERDIFVSFSIGVVFSHPDYCNPEELLRDGDIAMYHAKSSGKDRYHMFTPSMREAAYQRLQLETDLRKAIQQQEFVLHYQPIIEIATGHTVGVEALIRWQHPTQGFISPEAFIPIAEETGFILKLGYWVLKTACYQLHLWQTQNIINSNFSVSVNVSASQFAQPDFIQQLDQILAETQLSPHCLKLEITETVIMHNSTSAANTISKLRERCIQLSIDDFGTGYSSLSYLHSFPVDVLKIDRSFIHRLHHEPSSLGLIRAIAQIAKIMGLSLVAEGIETDEQLAQLELLNCELAQGYLFSKPLSINEFVDFIQQNSTQNQLNALSHQFNQGLTFKQQ